jgi:D-alanine-D-alanine ligase
MENLKNIAVIYGGSSSEREISLQSGSGIYEAVRALGHESSLIDFIDLIDLTELKNNDLIFIALHGFEGEGGGLQKKIRLTKYSIHWVQIFCVCKYVE